jgi:hypothetical protein
MFPCLEAVGVKSVAEIGAFTGSLTQELLAWAANRETRSTAIDPNAEGRLVQLANEHPELELLHERSHDALARIELPDAVIFDGDHNYYAVSQDLELIEKRSSDGRIPLLIVHDVGLPHGRRDVYFEPDAIPEDHRQPMAHEVKIAPGNPGLSKGRLSYNWIAARAGGPRNGVLTAVEDFVSGHAELRLAVVPAFFGFAILWPQAAPWAGGGGRDRGGLRSRSPGGAARGEPGRPPGRAGGAGRGAPQAGGAHGAPGGAAQKDAGIACLRARRTRISGPAGLRSPRQARGGPAGARGR